MHAGRLRYYARGSRRCTNGRPMCAKTDGQWRGRVRKSAARFVKSTQLDVSTTSTLRVSFGLAHRSLGARRICRDDPAWLSQKSGQLQIIGKFLALRAAVLASIYIYVRVPRCPLFLRCGFVAFLFLSLTSGFGMQHLVWLVPWHAALSWSRVRWNYVFLATVFLILRFI